MDRRAFLAVATAAAVVAPAAVAQEKKDKPAMLPVIDTHQHLWDLTKFKLGWLKKGDPLDGQFTPTEYAAAVAGLNVVKSVYMEVDVVEEQQQAEADYVAELCKDGKTTMAAAVVSGRPASPKFATYVGQFKGSKFVKGVRQVLHVDATPTGFCLKKEFIQGVQLLGELGLSYDLCMRATDLPDAAKLADKCPDTRFILDHCGNPQHKFTKESSSSGRRTWRRWRALDSRGRRGQRNPEVALAPGFWSNVPTWKSFPTATPASRARASTPPPRRRRSPAGSAGSAGRCR